MRITYTPDDDGRDAYTVESGSGKTYRVQYCGSGDADPECVSLWECTCSAGEHGKLCKHMKAVIDALDETADEYGDPAPVQAGDVIGNEDNA